MSGKTDSADDAKFVRDEVVMEPGILGARWWQESMASAQTEIESRRSVLSKLLLGGVVVAGAGVAIYAMTSSGDEEEVVKQKALDLQRAHGWSFGAYSVGLVFDGMTTQRFEPVEVARLANHLTPRAHVSMYVPTLMESLTATPKQLTGPDVEAFKPLNAVIRPIATKSMEIAYGIGQALARLTSAKRERTLIVADVLGPEAVALAAGAADVFEPVLAIDNWPHPYGVVPSHLALAAALYYQPRFVATKTSRPAGALPCLVLAAERHTAYTDSATTFDNRWYARLPGIAALKELNVTRVLLIVPSSANRSPAATDVSGTLYYWQNNGVEVRAVPYDAFQQSGQSGDTAVYYGGSPAREESFFGDYGLGEAPATPAGPEFRLLADWRPKAPEITVSTGAAPVVSGSGSSSWSSDPDFGTVAVSMAAGGVITAAALGRRAGSRNRTSQSSGGWGGG